MFPTKISTDPNTIAPARFGAFLRVGLVAVIAAGALFSSALAKGGGAARERSASHAETETEPRREQRAGSWDLEAVGSWTIGFSRNGAESLCFARASYTDGPRLYVSIAHGAANAYLLVFNDAWPPLENGVATRLTLRFDASEQSRRVDAWSIGGDGQTSGLRIRLSDDAWVGLLRAGVVSIHNEHGGQIGAYELGRLVDAARGVARCLQRTRPGS